MLAQRHATHDGVLALFVISRVIMEEQGSFEAYPTLRLYSNWLLHAEINAPQHLEVLKMISQTSHRIYERDKASGENSVAEYCLEISRCFGLPRLRAELILLHGPIRHSLELFHSHKNWKTMAEVILSMLIDKPIRIRPGPNGPDAPLTGFAKELYDLYGRCAAISAEFSTDDTFPDKIEGKKVVLWSINLLIPDDEGLVRLSSYAPVRSPINFAEDRRDFLFD